MNRKSVEQYLKETLFCYQETKKVKIYLTEEERFLIVTKILLEEVKEKGIK